MSDELKRLMREYREAKLWVDKCQEAHRAARRDYDASSARLQEQHGVLDQARNKKRDAYAALTAYLGANDPDPDFD